MKISEILLIRVLQLVKSLKKHLPQPMTLSDWRNAANGIVLISNPYNQNDVERGCCIVEKLRHNGFHP